MPLPGGAVVGMNVVSDIATGIRNAGNGRSGSHEKTNATAGKETSANIRNEALDRGANAVTRTTFGYGEMTEGMLGVNLFRTTVTTCPE